MVYYYLFGVFYLSKLIFSGFFQFNCVAKITQNTMTELLYTNRVMIIYLNDCLSFLISQCIEPF